MTPFERAERAKQLLADEVLQDAFGDIRSRLIAQLESLPINDHETQHEITLMLQLLRKLREQLERVVQDGKVIEHRNRQQNWIEKMRERIA